MNRILYAAITLAVLASCSGYSYQILGTANGSALDEKQKLYLRTIDKDKAIDSCEVVHGKFHFSGARDSVAMALMYINGSTAGVPVVLEEGDITVTIGQRAPSLKGSYYNDQLNIFLKSHDSLQYQMEQLQARMAELPHKHSQAIMDGLDMSVVEPELLQESRQIEREAMVLNAKMDSLLTSAIVANADNVLGAGIFYLATRNYPYQTMLPWIVEVMSKTGDQFKDNRYVREYVNQANLNQRRELGLEPAQQGSSSAPSGGQ